MEPTNRSTTYNDLWKLGERSPNSQGNIPSYDEACRFGEPAVLPQNTPEMSDTPSHSIDGSLHNDDPQLVEGNRNPDARRIQTTKRVANYAFRKLMGIGVIALGVIGIACYYSNPWIVGVSVCAIGIGMIMMMITYRKRSISSSDAQADAKSRPSSDANVPPVTPPASAKLPASIEEPSKGTNHYPDGPQSISEDEDVMPSQQNSRGGRNHYPGDPQPKPEDVMELREYDEVDTYLNPDEWGVVYYKNSNQEKCISIVYKNSQDRVPVLVFYYPDPAVYHSGCLYKLQESELNKIIYEFGRDNQQFKDKGNFVMNSWKIDHRP